MNVLPYGQNHRGTSFPETDRLLQAQGSGRASASCRPAFSFFSVGFSRPCRCTEGPAGAASGEGAAHVQRAVHALREEAAARHGTGVEVDDVQHVVRAPAVGDAVVVERHDVRGVAGPRDALVLRAAVVERIAGLGNRIGRGPKAGRGQALRIQHLSLIHI